MTDVICCVVELYEAVACEKMKLLWRITCESSLSLNFGSSPGIVRPDFYDRRCVLRHGRKFYVQCNFK